MSILAVLMISSFFVLAAMVGLADAFVHFVCWSAKSLAVPRRRTGSSAGAGNHRVAIGR